MRIYWFFIWTNLIPFIQGCFVPKLVEIGLVVPSLLAKGDDSLLFSFREAYRHPWLAKMSGSGEEDFLISLMYFCYFIIISPWKRVQPFIWTNLNPLYPIMLCAKFGWKKLRGSGEKDFLNFVNVFSLFRNYLPFEKGLALHLNKLESPSTNNALWQVWLKLALWFWRRGFV